MTSRAPTVPDAKARQALQSDSDEESDIKDASTALKQARDHVRRVDSSEDEATSSAARRAAADSVNHVHHVHARIRASLTGGGRLDEGDLRPNTPPTGKNLRSRPGDGEEHSTPTHIPSHPLQHGQTMGGVEAASTATGLFPSRRHTVPGRPAAGPPPPLSSSKAAAVRTLNHSSSEEDEGCYGKGIGGQPISVQAADESGAAARQSTRSARSSVSGKATAPAVPSAPPSAPASQRTSAAGIGYGARSSSGGGIVTQPSVGGSEEGLSRRHRAHAASRLRRVSSNESVSSGGSGAESLASSRLTRASARTGASVTVTAARQRLQGDSSNSGADEEAKGNQQRAVVDMPEPMAAVIARSRETAASRRTTASIAGSVAAAPLPELRSTAANSSTSASTSPDGSHRSRGANLKARSVTGAPAADTEHRYHTGMPPASVSLAATTSLPPRRSAGSHITADPLVRSFQDPRGSASGANGVFMPPHLRRATAAAAAEVAAAAAASGSGPTSLLSPAAMPPAMRITSASAPALPNDDAPPTVSGGGAEAGFRSVGGAAAAARAVAEPGVQVSSAQRVVSWLDQQPPPPAMSSVGGMDDMASEYAATMTETEPDLAFAGASASLAATALAAGARRALLGARSTAGGNSVHTAGTNNSNVDNDEIELPGLAAPAAAAETPVPVSQAVGRLRNVRLSISSSDEDADSSEENPSGQGKQDSVSHDEEVPPPALPRSTIGMASTAASTAPSTAPTLNPRRLELVPDVAAASRPGAAQSASTTRRVPERPSPALESLPNPAPEAPAPAGRPVSSLQRVTVAGDALPAQAPSYPPQPASSPSASLRHGSSTSPSLAARIASAGGLRQLLPPGVNPSRLSAADLRTLLSALARPAWPTGGGSSSTAPVGQAPSVSSAASPSASPSQVVALSPRQSMGAESSAQPHSYTELLQAMRAMSSAGGGSQLGFLSGPSLGGSSALGQASRDGSTPRALQPAASPPRRHHPHPQTSLGGASAATTTAQSAAATASAAAGLGSSVRPSVGGSSVARTSVGGSSMLEEHPMAAPAGHAWSMHCGASPATATAMDEKQQRDFAELVRLWTLLTGRRVASNAFSRISEGTDGSVASAAASEARSPRPALSPRVRSRPGPTGLGGSALGAASSAAALAASAAAMATSAVIAAANRSNSAQRSTPPRDARTATAPATHRSPSPRGFQQTDRASDSAVGLSPSSGFHSLPPELQQLARLVSAAGSTEGADPHRQQATTPRSYHTPPQSPSPAAGPTGEPTDLMRLVRVLSAAGQAAEAAGATAETQTDLSRLVRLLSAAGQADAAPTASAAAQTDLVRLVRLLSAAGQTESGLPVVIARTSAGGGKSPAMKPSIATSVGGLAGPPPPSASSFATSTDGLAPQVSAATSMGGIRLVTESATGLTTRPVAVTSAAGRASPPAQYHTTSTSTAGLAPPAQQPSIDAISTAGLTRYASASTSIAGLERPEDPPSHPVAAATSTAGLAPQASAATSTGGLLPPWGSLADNATSMGGFRSAPSAAETSMGGLGLATATNATSMGGFGPTTSTGATSASGFGFAPEAMATSMGGLGPAPATAATSMGGFGSIAPSAATSMGGFGPTSVSFATSTGGFAAYGERVPPQQLSSAFTALEDSVDATADTALPAEAAAAAATPSLSRTSSCDTVEAGATLARLYDTLRALRCRDEGLSSAVQPQALSFTAAEEVPAATAAPPDPATGPEGTAVLCSVEQGEEDCSDADQGELQPQQAAASTEVNLTVEERGHQEPEMISAGLQTEAVEQATAALQTEGLSPEGREASAQTAADLRETYMCSFSGQTESPEVATAGQQTQWEDVGAVSHSAAQTEESSLRGGPCTASQTEPVIAASAAAQTEATVSLVASVQTEAAPAMLSAAAQTDNAGLPVRVSAAGQTEPDPVMLSAEAQTEVMRLVAMLSAGGQTDEAVGLPAAFDAETQTQLARVARMVSAAGGYGASVGGAAPQAVQGTEVVRVLRMLSTGGSTYGLPAAHTGNQQLQDQNSAAPAASAEEDASSLAPGAQIAHALRMLSAGGTVYPPDYYVTSALDSHDATQASPFTLSPATIAEVSGSLPMLSAGGTVHYSYDMQTAIQHNSRDEGEHANWHDTPAPTTGATPAATMSPGACAELVRAMHMLSAGGTVYPPDEPSPDAQAPSPSIAAAGITLAPPAQAQVRRALRMLSVGGTVHWPGSTGGSALAADVDLPGIRTSGALGRSGILAGDLSLSPFSAVASQTVVTRALKLPGGLLVELDPDLPARLEEAAEAEAEAGAEDGPWMQALRELNAALGETPRETAGGHRERFVSDASSYSAGAGGYKGGAGALLYALRMLASGSESGSQGRSTTGSLTLAGAELVSAAAGSTWEAMLLSSGGDAGVVMAGQAPAVPIVDCGAQTDLTAVDLAATLPYRQPDDWQGHLEERQRSFYSAQGATLFAAPAAPPSDTTSATSITAAPAVATIASRTSPRGASPEPFSAALVAAPGFSVAGPMLRNLPIASEGGLMDAPHQAAVVAGRVGSAGGMLGYLEAADPTTATALMELIQALQLMTHAQRRRRWVSDDSSTVSADSGLLFPGALQPPAVARPSGVESLGDSIRPIQSFSGSFVTSIGPSASQAGQLSYAGATAAADRTNRAVTSGGALVPAALPPRPRAATDQLRPHPAQHLQRALRAVSGGGAARVRITTGGAGQDRSNPSPLAPASAPLAHASAEAHICRALELLSSYETAPRTAGPAHADGTSAVSAAAAAAAADEAELRAQEELVAALMLLLTRTPLEHSSDAAAFDVPVMGAEAEGHEAGAAGPPIALAAAESQLSLPLSLSESLASECAVSPAPPAPACSTPPAPDSPASLHPASESSDVSLHATINVAMQQAEFASDAVDALRAGAGLAPLQPRPSELLEGVPFDQAIGFIMEGLRGFDGGPAHLARHLSLAAAPSSGGDGALVSSATSMGGATWPVSASAAAAAAAILASRRQTAVTEADEEAEGEQESMRALVMAAAAAVEALREQQLQDEQGYAPQASQDVDMELGPEASAPAEEGASMPAMPLHAPSAEHVPLPSLALAFASRSNSPARPVRPNAARPRNDTSILRSAPGTLGCVFAGRFDDSAPLQLRSTPGDATFPADSAKPSASPAADVLLQEGPAPSSDAYPEAAAALDGAASLRLIEHLADMGADVIARLLPPGADSAAAPGEAGWHVPRSVPVTSAGAAVWQPAATLHTFGGAMDLPADSALGPHDTLLARASAPILPYGGLDEQLMPLPYRDAPPVGAPEADQGVEEASAASTVAPPAPRLPTYATPASPAMRGAPARLQPTTSAGTGQAPSRLGRTEPVAAPLSEAPAMEQPLQLVQAEEGSATFACVEEEETQSSAGGSDGAAATALPGGLPQTQVGPSASGTARSAPVTTAGAASPTPARSVRTAGGSTPLPAAQALPATTPASQPTEPHIPHLTALDRFKPEPPHPSPYHPPAALAARSAAQTPSLWGARGVPSDAGAALASESDDDSFPMVRLARDVMTGRRAAPSIGGTSAPSFTVPISRRALFSTAGGEAISALPITAIAVATPDAAAAEERLSGSPAPQPPSHAAEALLSQAAALLLGAMQQISSGQPEQEEAYRILRPMLQGMAASQAAQAPASDPQVPADAASPPSAAEASGGAGIAPAAVCGGSRSVPVTEGGAGATGPAAPLRSAPATMGGLGDAAVEPGGAEQSALASPVEQHPQLQVAVAEATESYDGQDDEERSMPLRSDGGAAFAFTFDDPPPIAAAGTPTAAAAAGPDALLTPAAVEPTPEMDAGSPLALSRAAPEGVQAEADASLTQAAPLPPGVATSADLEAFKGDIMTGVRAALMEVVDLLGSTLLQHANAAHAGMPSVAASADLTPASAAVAEAVAPAAGDETLVPIPELQSVHEGAVPTESMSRSTTASGWHPDATGPGAAPAGLAVRDSISSGDGEGELRVTRSDLEAFLFGRALLSGSGATEGLLGARLRDMYGRSQPQDAAQWALFDPQDLHALHHPQSAARDSPPAEPEPTAVQEASSPRPLRSSRRISREDAAGMDHGANVPRDSTLRQPLTNGAAFKSLFRRSMEHLRGHLQPPNPYQSPAAARAALYRSAPGGPAPAEASPSYPQAMSPAEDPLRPSRSAIASAPPPSTTIPVFLAAAAAAARKPPTAPSRPALSAPGTAPLPAPPSTSAGRASSAPGDGPFAVPAAEPAWALEATLSPGAAAQGTAAALEAAARAADDVELEPHLSAGLRAAAEDEEREDEEVYTLRVPDPAAPPGRSHASQGSGVAAPSEAAEEMGFPPQLQPPRPSRVPGHLGAGWEEDDEEAAAGGVARARSEASLTPTRLRLRPPTAEMLSRSAAASPAPAAGGAAGHGALSHYTAPPSRLQATSLPGAPRAENQALDGDAHGRALSSFRPPAASEDGVGISRARTPPRPRPGPGPALRASAPGAPLSALEAENALLEVPANDPEDLPAPAAPVVKAAVPAPALPAPAPPSPPPSRLDDLEATLRTFRERMLAEGPSAGGADTPGSFLEPAVERPTAAAGGSEAAGLGSIGSVSSLTGGGVAMACDLYSIRASAAAALAAAAAVSRAFPSGAGAFPSGAGASAAGAPTAAAGPLAASDGVASGAYTPASSSTPSSAAHAAAAALLTAAATAGVTAGGASPAASSGGGAAAAASSRGASTSTTPSHPVLREQLEHFQALLDKANQLADRLMDSDEEEEAEADEAEQAGPLPPGPMPPPSLPSSADASSAPSDTPLQRQAEAAEALPRTPQPHAPLAASPSLDPDLAALFPATASRLARPPAHLAQSPAAASSLVDSALAAVPQLAAGAARARSVSVGSTPLARSPAASLGGRASATPEPHAASPSGSATSLAVVSALLGEAHGRMQFRSLDEQRGADMVLSAVLDAHFARLLGTPRGFLTPQRAAAAVPAPAHPAEAAPEAAGAGVAAEAAAQPWVDEVQPAANLAAAFQQAAAEEAEVEEGESEEEGEDDAPGLDSLARVAGHGQDTEPAEEPRVAPAMLDEDPSSALALPAPPSLVPPPPRGGGMDEVLQLMMQQRSDLLSSALDAVQRHGPHAPQQQPTREPQPAALKPLPPVVPGLSPAPVLTRLPSASAPGALAAAPPPSAAPLPDPFAALPETLQMHLTAASGRSSSASSRDSGSGSSLTALPIVPRVLSIPATSAGAPLHMPQPLMPYQEHDNDSVRTSYNVSLAGSARHAPLAPEHHDSPAWVRMGSAGGRAGRSGSGLHLAHGPESSRPSRTGSVAGAPAPVYGSLAHLLDEEEEEEGALSPVLAAPGGSAVPAPLGAPSVATAAPAAPSCAASDASDTTSSMASYVAGDYMYGTPHSPHALGPVHTPSAGGASAAAAAAGPFSLGGASAASALQLSSDGGAGALRYNPIFDPAGEAAASLPASLGGASASGFTSAGGAMGLRGSGSGSSGSSLAGAFAYTPLAQAAALAAAEAAAAASHGGALDAPPSPALHARLLSAGGTSTAVLDTNPAFGVRHEGEEEEEQAGGPEHRREWGVVSAGGSGAAAVARRLEATLSEQQQQQQPRMRLSSGEWELGSLDGSGDSVVDVAAALGALPLSPVGPELSPAAAHAARATSAAAPRHPTAASVGGASSIDLPSAVLLSSGEAERSEVSCSLLRSGLSQSQLALLSLAPELPASRPASGAVQRVLRAAGEAAPPAVQPARSSYPGSSDEATTASASFDFDEISREAAEVASAFAAAAPHGQAAAAADPLNSTLRPARGGASASLGGGGAAGAAPKDATRRGGVSAPGAASADGPFPLAALLPASAAFGAARAGAQPAAPAAAPAPAGPVYEAPPEPLAAVEEEEEAPEAPAAAQLPPPSPARRASGPAAQSPSPAATPPVARTRSGSGLVAAAVRRFEAGMLSPADALPLHTAAAAIAVASVPSAAASADSPKPAYKPAARVAPGLPRSPTSPSPTSPTASAPASRRASRAPSPGPASAAASPHGSRRGSGSGEERGPGPAAGPRAAAAPAQEGMGVEPQDTGSPAVETVEWVVPGLAAAESSGAGGAGASASSSRRSSFVIATQLAAAAAAAGAPKAPTNRPLSSSSPGGTPTPAAPRARGPTSSTPGAARAVAEAAAGRFGSPAPQRLARAGTAGGGGTPGAGASPTPVPRRVQSGGSGIPSASSPGSRPHSPAPGLRASASAGGGSGIPGLGLGGSRPASPAPLARAASAGGRAGGGGSPGRGSLGRGGRGGGAAGRQPALHEAVRAYRASRRQQG